MSDSPAPPEVDEFVPSPELAARLAEYDPDPAAPLPDEPSIVDEQYHAHVERGLARLPAKYDDADLELCPPEVVAWADGGWLAGRSLLLTGPTGTGKTFAAYAAIKCLVAAGVRHIERYTEPQLLGRLRQDRDIIEDVIEDLLVADLVFLDDLGSARASGWTEEVMYRVIDGRYSERRPILAASNVPPSEMSTVLGSRIASRLAEMCAVVAVVGEDRRIQ